MLSAKDGDKAVEAYDMALSYDPGAPGALNGLAAILEKRGEWAQLLDIFEARTESGTPEERAHALRHLAHIAGSKLNDGARAERYLKQAIDLAPIAEDYEQLLAIYGDDPARAIERRQVMSGILATSGPWMSRLGDLGRTLAGVDRKLAWCLLSPMAGMTIPDAALKGLVLELRKELEKADNLAALSPDLAAQVRPTALDPAIMEVLAEVDAAVSLGAPTPEAAGASGSSKADARTALGKTFAALAEKLGVPGATLWRAQTLSGAPLRVLDGDAPAVVVRSELLQLLPIPEINLLFTMLLEMTRPGTRLLLSLAGAEPALDRALIPAILAAAGPAGDAGDPRVNALAEKLRASADHARRAAWADKLEQRPSVAADPAGCGSRLAIAAEDAARRVALVGVPDLRTAARLLTRLDDSLPKMPSGGPLADMDTFIAGTPPLKALIGFAASAEFADLLGR
jgi:tetratricopeptide (TPR) repeat protein